MLLQHFPPMGVYETLYKFLDATGRYMGTTGTRPWAQGFPLTTQLPGGPPLPSSVEFDWEDLKYPVATGVDPLREAIAAYYNEFYSAGIGAEHVCVFAGGRPGIAAALAFLLPDIHVLIEETEYTPYWDMLQLFRRDYSVIPSHVENRFRPTLSDYIKFTEQTPGRSLIVKSNPCNPTGVTWRGEALREFVEFCSQPGRGVIIDEAYELFNAGGAESALQYIDDIDRTDILVVGAATKGLQAPGIRIGWVVGSQQHIEVFRNYSSIGMGGVSRLSQICATQLLQLDRMRQARRAVQQFFDQQRERYALGLAELGIELFTGDGGFYHWGRLPGGQTADELNERLFEHHAAILPGPLCDMLRRGNRSPLVDLIRFSFGPLQPESYQSNLAILKNCLLQTV